jgi:type IV secretory pathway TrbD component
MKLKNIGNTDRIIRIVLGVAIAILGVVFKSWLGLIALVPLATAAVSTCPLYLPFGISTRRKA